MSWSADVPYAQLPPLRPGHDVETRAVLKATVVARDALGRFDARSRALPNPTILINAIPILEAQASSEIENIVTTTDELFTAAASDAEPTPQAKEALRYRSALRAGFEWLDERPITAGLAIDICSTLRGHEEGARRGPVYIGNPSTGSRVYTPPETKQEIERLLQNWEGYANAGDDVDPLVRMA